MPKTLSAGARQLPLRHISIRVPWNDTGWEGRVCKKPAENIACLILPRIRSSRLDEKENELAGASWQNLPQSELPPCMAEHGQFMSPFEITRQMSHPYAENSKAHKHLLPTPYRYASFSAAAVPFNWMLRESAQQKASELELGYQPDIEAQADITMGFKTSWVQEKVNQLIMLDTFLSAIQPEKSLVFFYAKRTPLVDDPRRVIIGIGRVKHVGDPVEYKYSEAGALKSILWERNIQHSIRSDFKDGFILPYHALIEYFDMHPDEDPLKYIAFVPDDQFQAFSYGSEHVTNDGAIGAILSCIKAIQNIQKVIPGSWRQVLTWLDDRLNELWGMRGPCPGLGSALSAFGVENGCLVAYELERILLEMPKSTSNDPWLLLNNLFARPEKFTPEISSKIGKTLQNTWRNLPPERHALLKLLSRFELTSDQATRYYVHEDKQRSDYGINVGDKELIANPYRLFEIDRFTPDPINLNTIDRGVFPDLSIQQQFPLPEPSCITDPLDPRRVAAFVIHQLEQASLMGHTLQTRDTIIQQIRELDIKPACPITGDHMSAIESSFEPRVRLMKLHDNTPAYQLDHLYRYGDKIRSAVTRRLSGTRHTYNINWAQLLDQALETPADPTDQSEIDARREKTAALEELYSSRFSVLIGPAGTGKTTLLKVLCHEPTLEQGGVLLLAPTGKARVRMETQTGISGAQTIAQFLIGIDRYEHKAGRYRFSEKVQAVSKYKTVIIDESSMLTEDQLAAVLDGVQSVERLILVGDPRQLPPIGAGRPFLDIVEKLTPENVDVLFPRVTPGYAELTIRRRQIGQTRDDLLLAEWFSGRSIDPGADEIWEKIEKGDSSEHLRFVQWENPDQLQDILLNAIVLELKLKDKNDVKNFELSTGGSEYQDNVFFWASRAGQRGACSKAEDWQILSPVHNNPYGVEALNRLIQVTFRAKTKESALLKPYFRKIPGPMGREEILYGDKVIQTQNQRRYQVYPDADALQYVANGELGIVVGQYKTRKMTFIPYALEVEFSSQPGYKYSYYGSDFSNEGNPALELAYALTVHKTQGSEFGITFVVIPNPCKLLSRELLYTALTRQKYKIIILHQGSLHEIKEFSKDYYSESAARLTSLFTAPQPVLVQERFLENKLINRTAKGLCVRSKSEVIIATELDHAGIDYVYDSKFVGQDGSIRYPDFVIDDSETGKRYYWEHLGMLNKSDYKKRWDKKLIWYERQGILPIDKGGGANGILLTTIDHPDGGIDVMEIQNTINLITGK
jgi:ATP-dependent exoDNAse (exonuclease V) alpha subunit